MSDARDPLVARAIYIRSFMERSRGDIKQWSWVWEKEIQTIEVRETFKVVLKAEPRQWNIVNANTHTLNEQTSNHS